MRRSRRAVAAYVNPGVLLLVAVLVAATAFGVWRRLTDGRIRGVDSHPARGDATVATADDGGERLTPVDLGEALGQRATLVQFSTAFCQPCRAARRILGEVAEQVDGVAHVEIDAESHLDLVRRLDVMRTPTVLVLDGAGRVVRRAVGLPRKADVIAALGEAIP
jgi:thiol-disulfide isomerase/thioredoxin